MPDIGRFCVNGGRRSRREWEKTALKRQEQELLQCNNSGVSSDPRSGRALRSVLGGRQTQHFARFSEGTLARGRARTLRATVFFPCPSRLPAFFALLRTSRSLTLDLERQVGMETAGLDLGAEVMEVAQFVVHGLGAVFLGAKAALEFVQDRLSLLRRHTFEVACGQLALIGD